LKTGKWSAIQKTPKGISTREVNTYSKKVADSHVDSGIKIKNFYGETKKDQ